MKKILVTIINGVLFGLLSLSIFSVANAKSTKQTALKTAVTQGVHVKVNINKADIKQLQTLNGIGLKKAQAIIAYREANGKFKSISDLTKIKGIGEKKLDKISGKITV